jgi:diguanylate cyclase (GGDEF)-like protein
VEELNRLERKGPHPVTIIIADLNGLKAANDQWGHDSGEVFNELIAKPHCAARIGGDEFAVLLPATELRDGEAIVDSIHELVAVDNQFYPGLTLSLSMGIATSRPGERLESVAKRADLLMFERRRAYYGGELTDRRHTAITAA